MYQVRTPCIGVCSTGIGDVVCRGCKRFTHEVIHWNAYTASQRRMINSRLDSLLTQLIQPRVDILDANKLLLQLNLQKIRHNPDLSAYSWFMDLLKAGASQITDLNDYGCRLVATDNSQSLVELKQQLDEEFYLLSLVHYERYFAHYSP
ncbi:MAG: DUF1289 domain-containing protein [Moraxellaceae bacterium]|nr:MAG: DUF1289 domain-containing protein [Moraxellaceae bacterium]